MSVSLMTMEPFSGFSRPTSDFRNTDLPVPDGPSSTEISPGGRVSVTSLQMFWLPKDFVSPSTSTATPTTEPPRPAPLPAPPPRLPPPPPRQTPPARLLGRPRPHHDPQASEVCVVLVFSASGRRGAGRL